MRANEEISGIPKRKIPVIEIIENGQTTLLIEPSNIELAEKLGLATKSEHAFHDVVIIGAGPAGLTAAIYLARDGYDVLVVERSTVGGQAFITNRLDNYPGFPEGISGDDFADNLRRQAELFGVEILTPHEIREITTCHGDEDFDVCTNKVVHTTSGLEFTCSALLVASGSTYRELIVPGVDKLIGTSIHYCATCDAPFYKEKTLFSVGGGNSAFEESLYLKTFAKKVVILVRSSEPTASPALQEKVENTEGIEVWLNSEVKEIQGVKKMENIVVYHKDTEQLKEYQPDGLFIFIGLTPNTKFLPNKIQLDSKGFIISRNNLQTSVKGIYAAGDCRKDAINQVVSAAGEGASAAIHIREFLQVR